MLSPYIQFASNQLFLFTLLGIILEYFALRFTYSVNMLWTGKTDSLKERFACTVNVLY